ncbi:uncharacterized protein LOC129775816 [Toxorhynchites rutilus septentrionalis]|uniref:uncharacterized protein LOC129775816 n=1 Tax=Toxorhynchites rutilus septentrionalis TaxID=329112 RepID=UPI002478A035|nr:uncharacterized protein LOC129775816 [Toxorhynchites rutilus septentrionalis]
MFKILSETAKGIPVLKQLESAGKLSRNRPFSSSGKKSVDQGLTDFSQRKECQQQSCAERSRKVQPEDPPSNCEKMASPKTWRACPEPPKPKEFSCDDTLQQKVPRRKKRPVTSRPACSKPAPSLEAPECVKIKQELCPRTSAPGCTKAKFPPKCEPKKVVRDCVKLNPPVPSFSECYKNPFPPQPRSECTCLTVPKICL